MTTGQVIAWLGMMFASAVLAFIAGRISGLEDKR